MTKLYILPYKQKSMSAELLARAVGAKIIKLKKSKFKATDDKLVINWGSCSLPEHVAGATIINKVPYVQAAANKLIALRTFRDCGISIPPFVEDIEDAKAMAESDGGVVLCRTVLRGTGGAGIVIANNPGEVVPAKLYTQYIKKKYEYRVHVFGGLVRDVQQKLRKSTVPDSEVDWKIRNHKNGFVYARAEVKAPLVVLEQAVQAVAVLNLDFGAVDIIYNEHMDQAFVLEVNTAPGLEGSTLDVYKEAVLGLAPTS